MAIGLGAAMLGSGIAGGIGSILSSALQFGSQAWSQDFNKKEAEKARQFSHDEAQLNRDFESQQAEISRQWQTDMSNSAYQRSMNDMQQAGLNPNLMAGGLQASTGNASTPQGSQAQTSSASSSPLHFSNMLSGVTSALNAYATLQNQQLIAKMYNNTSLANNQLSNNVRASAYSAYDRNFQNSIWKYRKYGDWRKTGTFEEL